MHELELYDDFLVSFPIADGKTPVSNQYLSGVVIINCPSNEVIKYNIKHHPERAVENKENTGAEFPSIIYTLSV